jgi:hypothetical protein
MFKRFLFLFFAVLTLHFVQGQNNNFSNYGAIYSKGAANFTVAVQNNVLTGGYLCLTQWDSELHVYMHQEFFHFYGTSTDGINFKIIAQAHDFDEHPIPGTLRFLKAKNKIKVLLKAAPGPGVFFDITKDSEENEFPLVKVMPIIQVTTIVSPKIRVKLYNFDGHTFTSRKAYLTDGDEVQVLKHDPSGYSKVIYTSIESQKLTEYWVKTINLQPADVSKWKFPRATNKY